MPPWGWWPLAVLGFVVVDRLLAGQPAKTRAWRLLLVGVAWLLPATFWMVDLTLPGYVVTVVAYAAMLGLAGLLTPPGPGRWLALPGLVVLWEAIRWRVPFGGVPLATLPMSQVDGPLGFTVRLLGPLLLAALVVVMAMALAALVERRWWAAGAAVAVVVAATAGAAVSPRGTATDTIDVAIVQGGGPQRTRAVDTNPRDVFERHLEASQLVETPVDVVLWPEDVVDVPGLLVDSPEHDELAALARQLDATLIVGIVEDIDDDQFANASVVFSPDGEIVDRYDKVRRVPFGEFVPFRSLIEPFASEALPVREARPGTEEAVVETEFGTFGVNISWEVFFEDRARDAIGNGGAVLLNPTNGSSYWLTIVQSQQVASSQLRALETGRYVLQAAPTGFSAIVTPDGDVLDRTGVSEQQVIHGTIELREGQTVATRVGLWPMLGLGVLALCAGWLVQRRQTSSSTVTGPSLTSSTDMSAPNTPVATVAPDDRS